MPLTLLGDPPLATDDDGQLKSAIATIFPRAETLVTLPGTHFKQRLDLTDDLSRKRVAAGSPPLTDAEMEILWNEAVDLYVSRDGIQIRPDPGNMDLACEADRLLQELPGFSKMNIRFLYVRHAAVQEALRRRGEYWRISAEPHSRKEIADTIERSRIAIFGEPIYYYNKYTGTRYLTPRRFAALSNLDDAALRAHLAEIGRYAAHRNRRGHPEMAFFAAGSRFHWEEPSDFDWAALPPADLRERHGAIARRLLNAVNPSFREDDPGNDAWLKALGSVLEDSDDETIADNLVPGIPPEFFMQVRWLPGGRIEQGELILDPVLMRAEDWRSDPLLNVRSDPRVNGFVCNYTRDFGNLEYVNIGYVLPSVRRHKREGGHRAYIAEVKHPGAAQPTVRILRLQKWDIREHLDQNWDLLPAILEAQEYTEFILDRRLGCWQLGMPLSSRFDTRRIPEIYNGPNDRHAGQRIWTTYFERDFIPGVATDKIPREHFEQAAFALAFAQLLGEAAAPNLVVGRANTDGEVIFDDGDEVLMFDEHDEPKHIIVADHAGTFTACDTPLEHFAEGYARAVVQRAAFLPDRAAFADRYTRALGEKLTRIQESYRRYRRAFDSLFRLSKQGKGTFAHRWSCALNRLELADVPALVRRVRERCDA